MKNNYHTHTPRCGHASGTEEEYVLSAIDAGFENLGFSDHTPYIFDDEFYHSTFRMKIEDFDDYCEKVLLVKDKYKDRINVHLGLEVEYYPAYFNKLINYLGDYPVEYMILGQHFIGNEIGDHYNGEPSSDEKELERYVKQSLEGFDTGYFKYFAHPDLFFYTGNRRIYEKWMRYLCQGAREKNMLLEINHLGIHTNRHYPNEFFWKIAGEEGCKVILGSDAHNPSDVYRKDAEAIALDIIKNNNLILVDNIL